MSSRSLFLRGGLLTLLTTCWLLAGSTWAQAQNRIAVDGERFVDSATGQTFTPRGFNYIRLSGGYHGTFRPGEYDGSRASTMFDDLSQNGFNTVRVFIDPNNGRGIAPLDPSSMELNTDYLNNFTDFLGRAEANNIRVITTFDAVPFINRYAAPFWNNPAYSNDPSLGTENQYYQLRSFIDARAQYYADVAQVVKNAGLSSTVLSYEIQNELSFYADRYPYSELTGSVVGPDGNSYLMSDASQRQALADASMIMASNEAVRRIQQVDEQALVSGSVFSSHAVNRTGPGDNFPVNAPDRWLERFPARLAALAESDLSYLDVHLYPNPAGQGEDFHLASDLASMEWDLVQDALTGENAKPILMGEFGAFLRESHYTDIDDALAAILDLHSAMSDEQIAGYLYWTYDTDEQPDLWNSKSGDGRIFAALAALNAVPEPSSSVVLLVGFVVSNLVRRKRSLAEVA